jgi:hypothetical protein
VLFWQGRTGQGHSSNATLAAGAFLISYSKFQKRGLLEEFWRFFEFFCMDGRRGLLIPVCLCLLRLDTLVNISCELHF